MAEAAVAVDELVRGDQLRYQLRPRGHWRTLTFHGRNSDGSLDCYDTNGAARALLPTRYRFEVKRQSTNGSKKPDWLPLTTGET